MNAAIRVGRLLEQSGAVLVRNKRHLVYRLPNGSVFTQPKTPSDWRSSLNELSDLRRALGVSRQKPESKPKGERPMPIDQIAAAAPTLAPVALPASAAPAPSAPDIPTDGSLKQRIEVAIARTEQEQETFLAAAQKAERRAQMLRALLPFVEDAATENVLRALLETEPTAPTPVPALAPPPRAITECVQVTRQLVLAATQTFDGPFTVNDVLALMTGGREIDGGERTRVRSSIAQCMMGLFERGELIREAEGIGKRQAIWRKAALNGKGISSRTGTRA